MEIKVADEVWISCALLQTENPEEQAFSNSQIMERIKRENIFGSIRPGIQIHISTHCVANVAAKPNKRRMLYRLPDGRKRLFKDSDNYDTTRKNGKIIPERAEIPKKYWHLLTWYNTEYNRKGNLPPPPRSTPPPIPIDQPFVNLKENQLELFSYKCSMAPHAENCKSCELFMDEDTVKTALVAVLQSQGWDATPSMGRKHGVDILAKQNGETMLIEAKGEGSRNAMRVNYFLMALGEILQKMNNENYRYALAFPAYRQYANLIIKLPKEIKQKLKLSIYLVKKQENGTYCVGLVEY